MWELVYKERDANLFPFYVFAKPWGTMIHEILGRNLNPIILEFSKKGVRYYVNHEEFRKLGREVFKNYMDKKFYLEMSHKIDLYSEKVTCLSKEIEEKDLQSCDEKQQMRYICELCALMEKLDKWGQLTSILEYGKNSFLTDGLMQEIERKIIEKKLKMNKVEVSKLLSMPIRGSYFREEKIALMQLALKIQKQGLSIDSNQVRDEIEDIRKAYCWILFGYVGPALTFDDLKEEVKELTGKKDLKKALEEKKQELKNCMIEQENAERLLGFDEYYKQRFSIVRDQTFYKEHRKEVLFHGFYVCELMHSELARRWKVDKKIFYYLLPEEYGQDIQQLYEKRKDFCVYFMDNNSALVLTGKEAEEKVAQIDAGKPAFEKITELKGNCAYAGNVTGTVKIVMGINHLEKLKEGDILVSYSTNPQMTIAMYKAGAVITEQGGIASHAAIVSREMKIPCLVGVKGATEALSDGDVVEVEAAKGIIRIIKKAD